MLVAPPLARDTPTALWKRDHSVPPTGDDVSEDFRGRVYPAGEDTDPVDIEITTDEDFTTRVQTGKRFRVKER